MTTGSYDNSVVIPNYSRRLNSKTWNGDDRPKLVRSKPPLQSIITRQGEVLKWRPRRLPDWQPKRVTDQPHNYFVEGYLSNDPYALYLDKNDNVSFGFLDDFCSDPLHLDGTNYDVPALDANDMSKVIAKLREKLFGSDFNLSVFLGEAHQTLALIADSATRIYSSLRALKRGRFRDAAHHLVVNTPRGKWASKFPASVPKKKTLSDLWLELQYGWMPLLSDTQGAAEALAQALEVPFAMKTSATRKRTRYSLIQKGGINIWDDRYSYILSSIERLKVTVFVTEKPSVAAQLGLLNPENVAWELLPFSFVADWFIPIGQYLDARAVTSCVSGTWVVSQSMEAKKGGMVQIGSNGNVGVDGMPFSLFTGGHDVSSFFRRRRRFTRSVSSSPPALPLPQFKGLGKSASWQHCVNAVALLTSLSGGGGSRFSR
jgi:hypothetical protein